MNRRCRCKHRRLQRETAFGMLLSDMVTAAGVTEGDAPEAEGDAPEGEEYAPEAEDIFYGRREYILYSLEE